VHLRRSIKEAAGQDQTAGDGFLMYLVVGENHVAEIGVVGSKDEDKMDAGHTHDQRNQCKRGDPILEEQSLRANEAAGYPQQDHQGAKGCGPPADKQRRLVAPEGPQLRGL